VLIIVCCLGVLLAAGWWWTRPTGHYGELDAQVSLGPSCQQANAPESCRRLRGHPLHVVLYNVHDNTWNRVYTTDPSGRLQVRVPQGTYWIAFADGDTGLMTNRAQRRFTITSRGANIGRVWPKDLRPYRAYESG
jgi:hypothetical protein